MLDLNDKLLCENKKLNKNNVYGYNVEIYMTYHLAGRIENDGTLQYV